MEYKYKFEIKLREKIAPHNYSNVNLRISNLKDNINILIVINVSWALELGHSLLSIISLAKKDVKVFIRKTSQLLKIIVNKVFSLADIIENQYIIQLAENSKSITINQVTAPIIKTWYM